MRLEDLRRQDGTTVVYDGACPFCRRYVAHLMRQRPVRELHPVDARDDPELVLDARAAGFALDEGMLIVHRGEIHYGPAAVRCAARAMRSATGRARHIHRLFRNRALVSPVYALVKGLRKLWLKLRGIPPL